jgi:hypothetical protein
VRFFTGGRKAVNIEILLRKLGSPAEVAQAIVKLDATRLPVSSCHQVAGLQAEAEVTHNLLSSTALASFPAFLCGAGGGAA